MTTSRTALEGLRDTLRHRAETCGRGEFRDGMAKGYEISADLLGEALADMGLQEDRYTMREVVQALTEHYSHKNHDRLSAATMAIETMAAMKQTIERNRAAIAAQKEPK